MEELCSLQARQAAPLGGVNSENMSPASCTLDSGPAAPYLDLAAASVCPTEAPCGCVGCGVGRVSPGCRGCLGNTVFLGDQNCEAEAMKQGKLERLRDVWLSVRHTLLSRPLFGSEPLPGRTRCHTAGCPCTPARSWCGLFQAVTSSRHGLLKGEVAGATVGTS